MPNIQDHALATGGYTLAQRPFDALDSLVLTQLVYMPMEGLMDRGQRPTAAQAWAYIREHVDYERLDTFQKKRYRLFECCAGLKRYRDLPMHDYVNIIDGAMEMQFCACTWDLSRGECYIAFRGTDLTIAGWKEDLNMSFMTVPSQKEAVAYTERMARRGVALRLGGHSKGGNLAVYAGARVAPSVQERILRVYSFDGPGVDEETLGCQGYERISARIESYIPQSSVVGMLLHLSSPVHGSAIHIPWHSAARRHDLAGGKRRLRASGRSGHERQNHRRGHSYLASGHGHGPAARTGGYALPRGRRVAGRACDRPGGRLAGQRREGAGGDSGTGPAGQGQRAADAALSVFVGRGRGGAHGALAPGGAGEARGRRAVGVRGGNVQQQTGVLLHPPGHAAKWIP